MTDVLMRSLADEATHLTSARTLRRALNDQSPGVGHSLKTMRSVGILSDETSVGDALESAAQWMISSYRNESVYKNAIADQILIQRHGLRSTALVSELKIGTSVADCVIVNGHATVYEIKTELDNPGKLLRQLEDYRRAFRRVVLVTHRTLAKSYVDLIDDPRIGVLTLNNDGRLWTRRRPLDFTGDLSVATMMKTLRRNEYTRIAEQISGHVIDVPATMHFRTCLEISQSATPVEYSKMMEAELRRRSIREKDRLIADHFRAIRHQALRLNPSATQIARIENWLTGKA